jgi:hypothetical protein
MPKFPEPPAPHLLADVEPDLYVVLARTELWRIYGRGGPHPRAWNTFRAYGPVKNMRFDHHAEPVEEQDRKVLYGASRIPICVAEFFQRDRTIDRYRGEPWLVGFTVTRDVTLLNLHGPWPTRAGASMAINSGIRARSRRWSRAIYEAYPDAEGLWYPSSMYANQPAFAFYERAEQALSTIPIFHMPLSAPGLYAPLDGVAREIGYRFL